MYQVKNISGGLLVCSLADKETTLRVYNKETVPVADNLMTDHIFNLEKKKLVKLSHVEDEKPVDPVLPEPDPVVPVEPDIPAEPENADKEV